MDSLYEKILLNLSPLEVAEGYLDLKKSGKNYMAVCPFHSDTKPSLSFDPERGLFYCFGCGKSGNLLHLVAELEGVSIKEALKILANKAGIELKEDKKGVDRDRRMYELLDLVCNIYHDVLFSQKGERGINYIKEKDFSISVIREFKIGYAPSEGDFLLKELRKRGIKPSLLLEAGLIVGGLDGKVRDFFRDRIIFPIYSVGGSCIAFGGRAIEGEPKYLNSPDTKIFKKSRNLFGLQVAKNFVRKEGFIIIVEGYTDVLRMVEKGFKNTVAPLGTAFSIEQSFIIKRLTENVILLYDGDEAGLRGAKRALKILLSSNLLVKLSFLPEGEDPESFLRNREKEEMENIIKQGKDFISALLPEKIPSDPYTQKKLLEEILEFVSVIPSLVERELFLKKLSDYFLLPLNVLRDRIKVSSKRKEKEILGDLSSDFFLFGSLVSRKMLKRKYFEEKGLNEKVFEDKILRGVIRRIMEGEEFEDILLDIDEKDRERILNAVFTVKDKFPDIDDEEVWNRLMVRMAKIKRMEISRKLSDRSLTEQERRKLLEELKKWGYIY